MLVNSKPTSSKLSSTENERRSPQEELGISDGEFLEMGEVGAIYYRQGNLEKARTIFEGLVELNPLSADAHAALGALLTRTEEYDEALQFLNKAIALDREQIAPYVNRAEIYIRRQRAEEALADLTKAIDLDSNESDPAANRARAMVLGIHESLKSKRNM